MDALHHHITQWNFEVDVETALNSGMEEWFRMSLENHRDWQIHVFKENINATKINN